MRSRIDRLSGILVVLVLCSVLSLLVETRLPAGSRLGKVTGVMGEVIRINLGRMHGVSQGMRGKVFKFDENKKTVDVAQLQVIGVSDDNCLARITELTDTLQVGQFVDIEGTAGPRTLEKVDVLREMEESARNYFIAHQYTEPDSANCWAECQKILEREPTNRLALELKKLMIRNYYSWAERERADGKFTFALIYYTRILRIDPEEERAYENLWEIMDMINAEAQIPLEPITKGRPPDYYYAMAEQYFNIGQYEKSKAFYNFLLKKIVPNDLAAIEGIKKNDRMLELFGNLRTEREERARKVAVEEEKMKNEEQKKREKLELTRYFRTVADDLFQKKDYTGALVYYLKLLDAIPDDSVALAHREYISNVDMVLIPAGEFSRGSSSREIGETMVDFGRNSLLNREMPKKWVFLDSFYIDRYEVTNIQYKHFLESSGYTPPVHWKKGTYPDGEDNYPVIYVSWLDANAYARWIGRRLPTEEEWEKAARGANGFQWPWGDRFYPHRCNVKESGKNKSLPVGSFLSGANEFGVLDLAGNVWEWVDSDLKPYPDYDGRLDYFPSGYRKVLRGGSFQEKGDYARGAFRGAGSVNQIYFNVGFRCAKNLPGTKESPEG